MLIINFDVTKRNEAHAHALFKDYDALFYSTNQKSQRLLHKYLTNFYTINLARRISILSRGSINK